MSDRAIIEATRKMAGLHKVDHVTYINAVVDEVNDDRTCNCTAVDGHTEYQLPNVRLMATVEDGLYIEPVVGSNVKVIFSENIEPFVCQYSAIERVIFDSVNVIQFKDGSFDGLVKVSDLVTKLNNLENKVNSIISTFNSHTHPYVNVSSPAITSPSATPIVGTLTPTQQIDIENDQITHGI